jgi:hypothetical protein
MIVIALAAFTAAGAHGAQISQMAKTHRRSPAAATSRAAHRPALAHGARQAAPTHAKTRSNSRANLSVARTNPQIDARSNVSAARKRTPDEVGRTAGLAIRRQLARRQMEGHRAALGVERARAVRQPEFEQAALRSAGIRDARLQEAREAATANAAPDLRQTATDAAESMESRRMDAAHEQMPAEPRDTEASAEVETTPADRMTPAQSAMKREDSAAAQDSDAARASTASQPTEAADAAQSTSETTENEEASLLIPRGGMPAPLLGSLASLERQNDRLDAEGLERIEDEDDLAARIANNLLVPLPASSALTVNADLKENHRYCRPWTAKFLADLARAHEAAFHRPLEVSSAVRTVEYQKRLMETNGNAAPAEGDLVSPHLTGAAVDIAKSSLSRDEIAWMRRRLAGLQAAGKIDVEEEFQQACFHITVYKSYAPPRAARPGSPGKPATRGTKRQTADPAGQPETQGA